MVAKAGIAQTDVKACFSRIMVICNFIKMSFKMATRTVNWMFYNYIPTIYEHE